MKENTDAKNRYFTLDRILKEKAQYNVIFGERSNGKTFAVQERILSTYAKTRKQGAIIRRTDVDIESRQSNNTWTHFVNNPLRGNIVAQLFNGQYDNISYFRGGWYLSRRDEKYRLIRDTQPFCYAFAISMQEHYKSTSYPNITTILFDEFITRKMYLQDEFVLFQNVLSTIIRDRNDVTIFMCGNTVNIYNPYFKEMGLDKANKMLPGDIQLYEFAVNNKNEILKVAVQYADTPTKSGKPSDVYFAFGNPKLKMITNGMWELALYPHLPYKYAGKDVQGMFFIMWEDRILQCEIVQINIDNHDIAFVYIHSKTTSLQDTDNDIIFSTEYNPRMNWYRKLTRPRDTAGKRIKFFFDSDKVYYQDNEVGEVVRNYLDWCKTDKGFL